MVCQIQPKCDGCVVEFPIKMNSCVTFTRCKAFYRKKYMHVKKLFSYFVEDLTYGQYCIPPELYGEYGYDIALFNCK